MALHSAAQARNIFELGEVHLKEKARARCEGKCILGGGLPEKLHGAIHFCKRVLILAYRVARGNHRRRFIAETIRVALAELLASPVPMQIPISADIHDDI